jgi:PGF-pre-PGF domain-containing protein
MKRIALIVILLMLPYEMFGEINSAENVYFGDLHSHTSASDGNMGYDELFIESSGLLDFITVSDHGELLDNEEWAACKNNASVFTTGTFVGICGFEYTGTDGHIVVYNVTDYQGAVNGIDKSLISYDGLWDFIREENGVAHGAHPYYEAFLLDFDKYNTLLSPNVEIYSGNLALDFEENVTNEIKRRDMEVGFLGVSDRHFKEPGHGAITALWLESLTKDNILDALKNRRTYAILEANAAPPSFIIINATANAEQIGSITSLQFNSTINFTIVVNGTDKIDSIELKKDGETIISNTDCNCTDYRWEITDYMNNEDTFYYFKVVQNNTIAITSPFYFTYPSPPAPPSPPVDGGDGSPPPRDQTKLGDVVTPVESNVKIHIKAEFAKIDKGKTATIEIPVVEELPLTEMKIKTNKKCSNIKIDMKVLTEKPAEAVTEAADTVLKYLKIDHENIADEDIESVTVKFKVEKSWLDKEGVEPSTVVLKRHTGGTWAKLDTAKTDEDEDNVYYSAESPGLSYFAVAVDEPKKFDPALDPLIRDVPQKNESPEEGPGEIEEHENRTGAPEKKVEERPDLFDKVFTLLKRILSFLGMDRED